MNFKNWINDNYADLFAEMAFTSKNPVTMDEKDVAFLMQLPPRLWMQGLQWRYGPLLSSAVDNEGRLKKGWQDKKEFSFQTSGMQDSIVVDSYISHLVSKLKKLGYELKMPDSIQRQPDKFNHTLLYYAPMGREKANKLAYNARKAATGSVKKKIQTVQGREYEVDVPIVPIGWDVFIPNKMEPSRNDYDSHEKEEGEKIWNSIKDDVNEESTKIVDSYLDGLSDPEHNYHINHSYWNTPAKRTELLQACMDYVVRNLKTPGMLIPTTRKSKLRIFVQNQLQKGHISRRQIDSLSNSGNHPNDLLYNKKMTISQIKDLANAKKKDTYKGYKPILARRDRLGAPNFAV